MAGDAMRLVLEKALEAVEARGVSYGTPRVNHQRTADLWSAYLNVLGFEGVRLNPEDVCALNILQKLARNIHCHSVDNFVDIAGYAANMESCHHE